MNVFDRDYKDNKHIEDRTATAFEGVVFCS